MPAPEMVETWFVSQLWHGEVFATVACAFRVTQSTSTATDLAGLHWLDGESWK